MNRVAVIPFYQPWKSCALVSSSPLNGLSLQFRDLSLCYPVGVIGLRVLKIKWCKYPKRNGLSLTRASNLSPETRLQKDSAVISAPATGDWFLDSACICLSSQNFSGEYLFSACAKSKIMLPVAPALPGDTRPYHFTAPAWDSRICRMCLNTSLMTLCNAQHMWS